MATTTNAVDGGRPAALWRIAVRAALTAQGHRFRILAYHGVPDTDTFARHMARVSDHFTPVGPHEVVAALDGGAALPHDAVWVTFDDGDASVVDHGLPALIEHAVPATMFVCPGLVTSQEPFWWEITDRAVEVGLDRSVARARRPLAHHLAEAGARRRTPRRS